MDLESFPKLSHLKSIVSRCSIILHSSQIHALISLACGSSTSSLSQIHLCSQIHAPANLACGSSSSSLSQIHLWCTTVEEMSMTSKMKKGAKASDKARVVIMDMQASTGNLSGGDTSTGHNETLKYKQPYISWNKEMDSHLAKILTEQMAQGNKCDGDTWKPQALQAAVTYLNSKLHLNLTKDNIKNRLKNWKKYFSVVSDIQAKQSGFTWDEERKMIVVTSDEWSSWAAYVESHPDAKGMQNKMIENWDDIVLLCGKDRATGQGAETFEEGSEAMGEEDEIEVNSAPVSGSRARPSSSTDSFLEKKKKPKKDSLVEAVGAIATSFQEFLASKKKNEEKASGIEIHDVVTMIPGLNSDEVYKAVRKLMNGDPEEFKLLKALPDEKKKEWIYFLINS